MDTKLFIENFKTAFGEYELPIAFWYSEDPVVECSQTKACYIGYLKPAREGGIVSLSVDTIACPGGKVYAGFTEAPPFIPNWVSAKERYKDTPEAVTEFLEDLNIPNKEGNYLNFASIDQIDSFDHIEGLTFFATPDVLSGLISWVLFDTNEPDAISVPFGSGCSSLITQAIVENKNKGHRSFLGLFDPSIRTDVESNILTLSIPMSKFKKIYHTIDASCLQGTHHWKKLKKRIENDLQP
jgi:Uncharacterised ArCR, COG2043.